MIFAHSSDGRPNRSPRVGVAMLLGGMIGALLPSSEAMAETWPTKPIRLVIPYAAGGPVDIVTRNIGQRVGQALGQPVVIENRPGGNTTIGTEFVARSAPDGYTVLLATPSVGISTLVEPRPNYRMNDFVPVANIVKVPYVLAANAGLPVRSLADLNTLGRSRPSGLNNGIIGYGSVVHLTAELFRQQSGLPMTHIPYRGGGPATTALIAGEIDMFFTGAVNGIPAARSGTLRLLGVTHDTRLPSAPELPTFAEQGYRAVVTYSYYGILAPAGTPPAVVRRFATEIRDAAGTAEFRGLMERDGAVVDTVSGEAFGRMMAEDLAVWAEVIRQMGTQVRQ